MEDASLPRCLVEAQRLSVLMMAVGSQIVLQRGDQPLPIYQTVVAVRLGVEQINSRHDGRRPLAGQSWSTCWDPRLWRDRVSQANTGTHFRTRFKILRQHSLLRCNVGFVSQIFSSFIHRWTSPPDRRLIRLRVAPTTEYLARHGLSHPPLRSRQ